MFEGNSKELNHCKMLMIVLLKFCLMGDEYYAHCFYSIVIMDGRIENEIILKCFRKNIIT